MESKRLEGFLRDLVLLLRDKALEAKGASLQGDLHQQGRNFGLYETLSLIQQQAISFDIDLELIGMSDFDPDRDVL